MEGTKIEKFNFVCLNCQQKQQQSEVLLHVDWKKRYYMLTCLICQNMEAFDEFGQKVVSKKEEPKLQVN